MKILEALAKFQTQLEADGRSHHTIAQYRRHIRTLAHWLATQAHSGEIEAIGHETIASFLSSTQARTRPDGRIKKATAMNAMRSTIRTFFRYLHEAGYVSINPARLVRRAVCGSPPPRALSEDEATRLMDTLAQGEGPEEERDHAMFHTMLATGIRLGSAVALEVEDVDLVAGELHLRTMKGDRSEKVFLNKAIRDHLRRFIGSRTTGPLFPGNHGSHMSERHVQRRFRQWAERAGIGRGSSTHVLRHSLATSLYRRTGDIFLVKEALRHRSISSTMVYASMNENRLRAALEG